MRLVHNRDAQVLKACDHLVVAVEGHIPQGEALLGHELGGAKPKLEMRIQQVTGGQEAIGGTENTSFAAHALAPEDQRLEQALSDALRGENRVRLLGHKLAGLAVEADPLREKRLLACLHLDMRLKGDIVALFIPSRPVRRDHVAVVLQPNRVGQSCARVGKNEGAFRGGKDGLILAPGLATLAGGLHGGCLCRALRQETAAWWLP